RAGGDNQSPRPSLWSRKVPQSTAHRDWILRVIEHWVLVETELVVRLEPRADAPRDLSEHRRQDRSARAGYHSQTRVHHVPGPVFTISPVQTGTPPLRWAGRPRYHRRDASFPRSG